MTIYNVVYKFTPFLVLFGLYASAATSARASAGDKPTIFQVTASDSNTSGSTLTLDNPAINGKPKALLIVTQDFTGTTNNHPIGVFYNANNRIWNVVNEDGEDIPNGATFNVRAVPAKTSQTVQTVATISNSVYDFTIIDAKGLNKNPAGECLVTHDIDPDTALAGVTLTYNLGVYYDGTAWTVYYENTASPLVTAYNVATISGTLASVQTSTNTNISGDGFSIDDPTANGDSSAVIFVTHNYNPGGSDGGNYHDHVVGVYYTGSRWEIFNEDGSQMAAGESFNVLVYPSPTVQ